MSAGMQAPQSEPNSPASRAGSTIEKDPPPDSPPITPRDLTKLGVEPRPTPSVVPTTSRDEQLPSPVEPESPVGTVHDVSPRHDILPRSYFLPGVTLIDTIPHASGEFVDVWKGRQNGNQVCVKAFRSHTALNLDKVKQVRSDSLL